MSITGIATKHDWGPSAMREADTYFHDIPWDLIYDDNGELIGEVYLILPEPSPRRCKLVWDTTSTLPPKIMQQLKS